MGTNGDRRGQQNARKRTKAVGVSRRVGDHAEEYKKYGVAWNKVEKNIAIEECENGSQFLFAFSQLSGAALMFLQCSAGIDTKALEERLKIAIREDLSSSNAPEKDQRRRFLKFSFLVVPISQLRDQVFLAMLAAR